MNISRLNKSFGIHSLNKLSEATDPSLKGAFACLESSYYAFNNRNIKVLKEVWYQNDLSQLNNPLGGVIHGIQSIVDLYDKVFKSNASVTVEFGDIVYYEETKTVVFAGVENGEFKKDENTIPLHIRTTRFFGYIDERQRWFQLHHHGSIDDAALLKQYQEAVKV